MRADKVLREPPGSGVVRRIYEHRGLGESGNGKRVEQNNSTKCDDD
jgi:hypothetical protein